jgi:hypothetical protein
MTHTGGLCSDIPCPVITHYSSPTKIVCRVVSYEMPTECMLGDQWRLKLSVNGEEATSNVLKIQNFPLINDFIPTGVFTPADAAGFWTPWMNNQIPSASANEDETIAAVGTIALLHDLGCLSALGIEVRETVSGKMIEQDELMNGFTKVKFKILISFCNGTR